MNSRRRPCLRFAALGLLFALVSHAFSATLQVTNLTDNASGSLRQMISSSADGDEIQFAPGLSGAIVLGGTEILIDKSITITGPDANVMAVSGNFQDRVFRIVKGKTVSISGLTIRHGKVTQPREINYNSPSFDTTSGGGIFSEGILSLTGCNVTGNAAKDDYMRGSGGGIYATYLTLDDCTISNNAAGRGWDNESSGGDGGGLMVVARGVCRNSTFTGNGAGDGASAALRQGHDGFAGGSGGAIWAERIELLSCTITGNEVGVGGAPGSFLHYSAGGQHFYYSPVQGATGLGSGVFAHGSATLRNTVVSDSLEGNIVNQGPDGSDYLAFAVVASSPLETVGSHTVTVIRSGLLTGQATVSYSTSPGTALPATDYTTTSGTLTFEDGVATQTITIPILNNPLSAEDRTFTVQLSDPTGQSLGLPASHTVVIQNLNSAMTFASATYADTFVWEWENHVSMYVNRTGNLTTTTTVHYTTNHETATAGDDYTTTSGTLTFGPGEYYKQISVPLLDDSVSEPNETFTITLSDPDSNSILGARSSHTVMIQSDEVYVPVVRVVSNLTDHATAPISGSLRKAIADAEDGDTIDFAAGLTGAITLDGAELVIDKSITITGPGADVLAISGNHLSRVFRVELGKAVGISGLTIKDGGLPYTGNEVFDGGSGGGLLNYGSLTLQACRLSGNRAGDGLAPNYSQLGIPGGSGGHGGAIMNLGSLTLTDCGFENNRAGDGGSGGYRSQIAGGGRVAAGPTGGGGAIYNQSEMTLASCNFTNNLAGDGGEGGNGYGDGGSGGALLIAGGSSSISRSTFSGNHAGTGGAHGDGGAIALQGGSLVMENSTVSGNFGGTFQPFIQPSDPSYQVSRGGGIYNAGVLTLTACTVTGNSAGLSGGGMSGAAILRNTIVAGNNVGANGSGPDVSGALVSQGYNLIGKSDGSTGITGGTNHDLTGTIAAPLDPMLEGLADNGGPTLTHLLLPGSPAINAGDDTVTGTDQRGSPRKAGSHVDIGAVERNTAVDLDILAFVVATSTVGEGDGTHHVVVTRTGTLTGPASVQYTFAGGTADAGDFTGVNGTLSFGNGVASRTIDIPIINDAAVESDETFAITLSSPNGADLGSATHTVTIHSEDALTVLGFAETTSAVSETVGTHKVRVIRSGSLAGPVSVQYGFTTGAASAADFTAATGTLSFANGVSSQLISIPITNDTLVESDEDFVITLFGPSGAVLGTASCTVSIQSEDVPGVIAFESALSTVGEADGNATITLKRTGAAGAEVSVSYTAVSDSATAGDDFSTTSGTVTFAPGIREQTISVPIVNDTAVEGSERFTVTLSAPGSSATLGALSTHAVVITDDETEHTARKGRYHGIASREDEPGFGGVILNTTSNDRISGAVTLEGRAYRFIGTLGTDGSFNRNFDLRINGVQVRRVLSLQVATDGVSVTGSFLLEDEVVYAISADLDATGPVLGADHYTAVLGVETPDLVHGFLRVNLLPSGAAQITGALPDGASISLGTNIAANGNIAFFEALYSNAGYLAGTPRLSPGNAFPLAGTLSWQKPASTGIYPAGLDDVFVEVSGALYTPRKQTRVLDDFDATSGAGLLDYEGGDLGIISATSLMVGARNQITIPGSNPRKVQCKFQPEIGTFTGSFLHTDGKRRNFRGICVQQDGADNDIAEGFFPGTTAAGCVTLTAGTP